MLKNTQKPFLKQLGEVKAILGEMEKMRIDYKNKRVELEEKLKNP